MLDLSHIPNSQQDVRIFNANGSAWQTWQKPRKCNYVWIMCVGGGGGGGAGGGNSAQISCAGAAGAVTRALYNAQQLPDRLYIQVGLGGAGGLGGVGIVNAGSAGTRSFVALLPSTAATALIAVSGNAAAGGGTSGTVTTTVAGETASTQANANFYTLATFISTAGSNSTGGVNAPVDVAPLSGQITTPGGGGAGYFTNTTFNGGSILASTGSLSPLIAGGIGTSASGSSATNGADGITSWKPFFSTGGAGGGSATSGSGGNGGNGGIGSGGGGGGATVFASPYSQGSGGKGGDGIVIIISF